MRYAFEHPAFKATLGESDTVEVDGTYLGGDEKNKHQSKKVEGTQGRSTKTKKPVLGMVERGGTLVAQVVDDTSGAHPASNFYHPICAQGQFRRNRHFCAGIPVQHR